MYFGLIEDLIYYMNMMNKEFMEYQIKFVVVEIDGVLVYSKDEEEHENTSVWYCRSFKTIDYMPS
jgi:hypothetical protein